MKEKQPYHKNNFTYEDLILCAKGKLFHGKGPRLPLPPMLMVHAIDHIDSTSGEHQTGIIKAHLNLKKDDWFFKCHFDSDPVMPGCLGLDALWQLTGFFLGYINYTGKGRALGLKEMKFEGQVTPTITSIYYRIDIRRIIPRKEFVIAISDGKIFLDSKMTKPVYTATGLRVGLFEWS